MTQGGNAPLTAARVTVEVTAPKALDVSGLLLTESGKVRSDADFVFFNAPNGPGVTHRPASAGSPDAITVDTGAVPAGIDKIVVTASLDDAGATFAGTEPTATLRDADTGAVLLTFTPPRLTRETALVVVEVYRRAGAWKVRAVGQGYANGLAGIATDFGVSVDDSPAPPPMPTSAPTASAPAAPAPTAPAAAAPATATPPRPVTPPAVPASLTKVTLDKGKVSLAKGGSVSLEKAGKPFLSAIRMGLGWEPAGRGRNVDLDASCIAFDAQRNKIETAWFMKLSIFNGAIAHSGDNLTGEGAGDDESITVHLEGLPPEVCGLVFVVNSFSGQKFTDVKNAYCRLLDAGSGQELVRFDLTTSEPQTGVVMCKLVRQYSGEWVMTAIGEYVSAKTARAMVKPASAML
ncbi:MULTISPECIES: TerD family protein [unclassified Kitasatospora]|uniref:TerD family protein n=1 Tax=unclassified Kitasatospora TaxID=2633591 RepID=UPI00070E5D4E|nr:MULTISPECIES: TerD family protein [unclassified Kitasatospora]KQV03409.1 stress-induced protein [Kitasatospora sp. Root107]KRB66202.1 stress-induced protein [Kitasatospora sp. Root187]